MSFSYIERQLPEVLIFENELSKSSSSKADLDKCNDCGRYVCTMAKQVLGNRGNHLGRGNCKREYQFFSYSTQETCTSVNSSRTSSHPVCL